MIRKSAASGRFYPTSARQLSHLLGELVPVSEKTIEAKGIVVPHAGYTYSGRVAGLTYARVKLPRRFVILCPNHTGLGAPISMMMEGTWETPLGGIDIDREVASRIQNHCLLVQDNCMAHREEHAVEVQLPFLQHFLNNDFRFVPITVGTVRMESLVELGSALARVVRWHPDPILLIASTDLNHFESVEATLKKDELAIQEIRTLDAQGLFRAVHHHGISMCGYGPTMAVIQAARELGARQADLIEHVHSGEVTGERSSVVGYAGLVIH